MKPDSPEARYNLVVTLARQGNLEEAVTAYRRAIVMKPVSYDAALPTAVLGGWDSVIRAVTAELRC